MSKSIYCVVVLLASSALTLCIAQEKRENANGLREGVTVTVPALGFGAFRIPARDEIQEVEIELYESSGDGPSIASFKIEEKYIDEIYSFIENASIDSSPIIGWPDTASVRLKLPRGEVMRIAIHQLNADSPLQFSILGVRLKQNVKSFNERHGCGAFEGYIRRIYFWQTGHVALKLPSDTLNKMGLKK